MSNQNLYHWLAINGASVAASALPMPTNLEVSPRPHTLLGFETREEQRERHHFLLTAPIEEVNEYMRVDVPKLIKSGEIVVVQPRHPEPPTKGPTLWMSRGGQ